MPVFVRNNTRTTGLKRTMVVGSFFAENNLVLGHRGDRLDGFRIEAFDTCMNWEKSAIPGQQMA